MRTFHKLSIGDKFSDRPKESKQYQIYVKKDKRSAICIEQIGYYNTRLIGGMFNFTPNRTIYEVA